MPNDSSITHYDIPVQARPVGSNPQEITARTQPYRPTTRRAVQCSTCGMVLYGERAGEVYDRISDAEHGVCYRCYIRHARSVARRWPDVETTPYRPANRHIRPTVDLPRRMIETDTLLTPAVLRVYGELFMRGADRTWVAAPLVELAAALGYSRYHVYNAVQRLSPTYVEMRRESPHGVPAFRIVRALAGAA